MSITFIIIILTVGVSLYAWKNESFLRSLIFHPFSVSKKHQYYRFVTSGFLHADWTHLLFNMFSFYMFAQVVENLLLNFHGQGQGLLLFLLIYIGGIIVSDIYTFFKQRKNFDYYALGASGGVSAIIFSSILINPLNSIIIFPVPIPIKGFIFGFLYLIYSYFQGRRMGDNINHDAHFYGAIYGFVLTNFLVPGAFENFVSQIANWRMF
ncbi:rhomboid family intramembrane serine protease [Adhaeribacter aquaticus]|uniref:rhomboid family intramembrane serine protease n=1 Tax=Adhaeribacter aquaticus TaxID=299567 RepID=UPI00040CD963|nr:rhomboid family intramembrane serine protease [Adhaeribacter aquaticus]